ncbi:ABATE domain-containing protein [Burkholderia multivorans]|jgi:predicted RNA-binding Zn ribbon-like protein|uniref:CGNR zinc finger domain-containing protein n=1 Tax=Burkholderia multivorans TaxID=87883 RepID=UPI000CFFE8B8|nr:ABATE domain-containing protein [Burkholderia multivorans]MBU9182005.1 ABATE domain-containing protein [Burkholderia multivorans]MCL4663919.1 ABATE domain-containing protein [Burkholderia multivorans]MCO1355313.1 ABATE domain-containing protein [Burkholderia multivorans]MCO1416505.1 ABATE domain-containing protein [Burkholderia multivorans]MCO1450449.1 ABATE domain-containing protein [Burkholderia multivorans]
MAVSTIADMNARRAPTGPDCLIPAPADTLSIDFANTLYWRGTEPPTETLRTIDDLFAWCRDQAGVPACVADACRAGIDDGPAWLAHALALREALYRLFLAQAEQREPQAEDLKQVGAFLAEAPPRVALARVDGRYAWRIEPPGATLGALLSPVLWSATDLLGGVRLAKVKRCANDACQWLFVDDSKNGSRRWCSMSSCGNRAKAYRHYHKAD